MRVSLAEQRKIENEMFFRKANEKIGYDIDEVNSMLIKEGNQQLVFDDNILLHFKCECSDENCTIRLPIRWSVYKKIHEDRDTFIVKTNHQVSQIETVIDKEDKYFVVHKKKHVDKPSGEPLLHKTDVENKKT